MKPAFGTWDSKDADVRALGAFSAGGFLPGTDNHVTVVLDNTSGRATLSIVMGSDPPEPTNTVVVLRRDGH